jgi:hypothetical protein
VHGRRECNVQVVAGGLGHADPAMTVLVEAHGVATADRAVAVGFGEIPKREQ